MTLEILSKATFGAAFGLVEIFFVPEIVAKVLAVLLISEACGNQRPSVSAALRLSLQARGEIGKVVDGVAPL